MANAFSVVATRRMRVATLLKEMGNSGWGRRTDCFSRCARVDFVGYYI